VVYDGLGNWTAGRHGKFLQCALFHGPLMLKLNRCIAKMGKEVYSVWQSCKQV